VTQQLGARVAASQAPVTVIKWQSPSGAPEVLTVTLAPVLQPTSNSAPALYNSLYPNVADVTWGHGAIGVSASLDYPNAGGTFTVSASALQVDLSLAGVATWPGGDSFDNAVQLGAFMSVGASRPALTPPTKTVTLQSPTSERIEVPRFARSYYVVDNVVNTVFGADTVTWRIDCENRGLPYPQPGGLTQVIRSDVQLAIAAQDQRVGPTLVTPFALPARATHLQLTRVMGNVPTAVSVVFVLDLGA
jgi:hypothetical protein